VRPSGLACEILNAGADSKPNADQTVVIAYHACLTDGTEFDSTEQMGPVDAVLRTVVPGWREGLQLIGVGGKIRLYLPPALAFTDEDALRLGIPPASIVIAEIELKAIKPSPPEEPVPPSAPVPPPPPLTGFASEKILETWGWIIASERGVMQAELSASDRACVLRGLAAALASQPATFDEKAIYPHVDRYVAERQQAYQLATKKRRLAESAAFFEKLGAQPAVIHLPSGLRYEIVRAGHGDFPKADQRVRVNYTGRLLDGTIFDRTDPELGPLEIDVGKVIRGWTEGIQKINPGGIIRLYLPPELAYGDNATGGIPANSALIFEVELLEIHEVPAEEAAPPKEGAPGL
jgi:FKBP-type peptidyl-prolyl cis-trans isomerase